MAAAAASATRVPKAESLTRLEQLVGEIVDLRAVLAEQLDTRVLPVQPSVRTRAPTPSHTCARPRSSSHAARRTTHGARRATHDAQKYAALKTRLDALAVDEQVLRFQLETLQKELSVTCASDTPCSLTVCACTSLPPLTHVSSARCPSQRT